MNAFFHKAYDSYLLAITPDLNIEISEKLLQNTEDKAFYTYLKGLNGQEIIKPDRFLPRTDFLEVHYNKYKTRQI